MRQYEWDVETHFIEDCDEAEAGDILDHAHQSSYADCLRYIGFNKPGENLEYKIVLVCDVSYHTGDRLWAYMEGDRLPEFFEDAYQRAAHKVPQRFHQEVANAT
jgi:hypothetical protein